MTISFDKFKDWAEKRFGEIVVKGKEIRINSFFAEDSNFHLWCSPSGGKNKRKFGVFHCFKTDKKGSLVKLVQLVDKCDRDDALSILNGYSTIAELEKKLEEFFKEPIVSIIKKEKFNLPCGSLLISDLNKNNWWRKKAEEYLNKRKIPINGFYICTEFPYKARIIIPYYDKNKNLIYWNGRHISEKAKLRYLGPPKELGVGKEDVIYMAGNWPENGNWIHLCEGEFNAKSLQLAEFNGAACGGKNMSEKQALILSEYKIVLCLDRDKAGKQGTIKMSNIINSMQLASKSKEKLFYVRPAEGFNDWNEMYIKFGPIILNSYIKKYQKSIDYSAPSGTTGDLFF